MKLTHLRIGNIYEINGIRRVLDIDDMFNIIEGYDFSINDDIGYIKPSRIREADLPILKNINCYEEYRISTYQPTGIDICFSNEPFMHLEYINDFLDFMKKAEISTSDLKILLHNKEPKIKEKYKPINHLNKYNNLIASGLFFEFYPELTGNYDDDIKSMYE